jgi:hypothetical protein
MGLAMALAVALAALAVGCGVKTHPYHEMVTMPGPVEGLSQELDHNGHLWLTWRVPSSNMADRPMGTLNHFEVWAADYDLATYCDGCPVDLKKVDEVYLQAPAPGQDYFPGPYVWQTDLRQGRAYVFAVAGFSHRGGVHPEAWRRVEVLMTAPPLAMSGFSATAEDLAVNLRWPTPPSGQLVEVQRRRADETSFVTLDSARDGRVDLNVAYENEYVYRARPVIKRGETLIPGPWSNEVTVRVEDRIPPPPPAYLDAVITPEGVRLAWRDRREGQGVAGFYLYRSQVGSDNFVRLGGLMTGNSYLDANVPDNADLTYRLTAVDDSPRHNESAPSPEAQVFFAPATEAVPEEKPVFEDPGL